MATCPHCGTRGRTDPDAFMIEEVFVAKPPGSFSVAGATSKVTAKKWIKLSCRCGWSILGWLEDTNTFLGDPATQVWPAEDDTPPPGA